MTVLCESPKEIQNAGVAANWGMHEYMTDVYICISDNALAKFYIEP